MFVYRLFFLNINKLDNDLRPLSHIHALSQVRNIFVMYQWQKPINKTQ